MLSEKEESILKKYIGLLADKQSYTINNQEYDFYTKNEKKYVESLEKKGFLNFKYFTRCVIISLSADGESYFEMKEKLTKEEMKMMSFEPLDSKSEERLTEFLNTTVFPVTSMNSVTQHLIEQGYVRGTIGSPCTVDGESVCFIDGVTHKGKTYFEMKEKHNKQIEMNRAITNNIIINANGNYSPINAVQGDGPTTQRVDYANNEQIRALSQLADMINSAREFSEDERTEILELIKATQENSHSKNIIKPLLTAIGIALSKAPSFIVDKWEQIKTILGG